MPHRCHCPCHELRCADPSCHPEVSEQDQVFLVAELGLVAATIDEQIAPERAEAVATAVRLLPGMSKLSDSELNLLLARAGARSQKGQRWLCESANSIRSATLQRLAFRMAAMFCAWQGELGPRAQEYLAAIASAFTFSDAEAAELFAQATGWPVQSVLDSAG